jgi:enoyl-CoA hydratase/carnithine racemase
VILREDAGGVATLTLNGPEKLNAITREMLIELHRQLDAIAADETVGCVIVCGAGRCFGAGHDLAGTGRTDEGAWRHFDAETIDALEALPQPTIASVHGYCFTGSLELALACDLIVCAESAGPARRTWCSRAAGSPALYADEATMTRAGALAYERTRPYGLPGDRPKSPREAS